MAIERLEDRIDLIRDQIVQENWTIAASESAGLIELAFRELYKRSLGMLDGAARRRVFQAEQDIGKGTKTADDFTLGQLVGLFRSSQFLDAWADATGNTLRGLRMINLDQLVHLRNGLVHQKHEASRAEAELLFGCLQSVLETFGILTLEAPSSALGGSPGAPGDGRSVERADDRSDDRDRPRRPRIDAAEGRASSYRPTAAGEDARLQLQADTVRPFDLELLTLAASRRAERGAGFDLTVLDLGCASGEVTLDRFVDPATYGFVLGVDRDESCIERAVARAGEHRHVHFLQADLESFGFGEQLDRHLDEHGRSGLDLVFGALTLQHLANPIRLLRTLRYRLNDGAAVVVRGFDDGSIVQYPDPEGRVQRTIELTDEQAGVSDRYNGRKLHHWLYRAGFRDIELRFSVRTTAGRSPRQRNALFQESFAFRTIYFADPSDPEADARTVEQRRELEHHLDELELEFEDESSVFWELDVAAVAWNH